jgi:hypothetical protein
VTPGLFQTHRDWHNLLPFHEYFHGDTGRGVDACHQTGWTALVAGLVLRTATTAPLGTVMTGYRGLTCAVWDHRRDQLVPHLDRCLSRKSSPPTLPATGRELDQP